MKPFICNVITRIRQQSVRFGSGGRQKTRPDPVDPSIEFELWVMKECYVFIVLYWLSLLLWSACVSVELLLGVFAHSNLIKYRTYVCASLHEIVGTSTACIGIGHDHDLFVW